jgi:hypothetical protein
MYLPNTFEIQQRLHLVLGRVRQEQIRKYGLEVVEALESIHYDYEERELFASMFLSLVDHGT